MQHEYTANFQRLSQERDEQYRRLLEQPLFLSACVVQAAPPVQLAASPTVQSAGEIMFPPGVLESLGLEPVDKDYPDSQVFICQQCHERYLYSDAKTGRTRTGHPGVFCSCYCESNYRRKHGRLPPIGFEIPLGEPQPCSMKANREHPYPGDT